MSAVCRVSIHPTLWQFSVTLSGSAMMDVLLSKLGEVFAFSINVFMLDWGRLMLELNDILNASHGI